MFVCIFFFKQKTAYELRISDWSSDVCSSDLTVSIEVRSPLESIEAAVRDRAKDVTLEMDGPDALEALRSLIAEEVARWSLDHRRGLHPYDLAEPDIVIERAFRNLAGYGPLGPPLDAAEIGRAQGRERGGQE